MTASIDIGNSRPDKFKSLAKHPAIEEIEDNGIAEEGRFFVHLIEGYQWGVPYEGRSKSFASIKDAREMLKRIERKD